MRIVDTQKYLDNVCQILRQGGTQVSIPVSGSSMRPFLHPGDLVYLELPKAPPKRGDVVLFTRSSGQYILHRVYRVKPDGGFLMLGDNQQWLEPVPGMERIHAVVTSAQHKGKIMKPGKPRWWFYAHVWLWAAPWRRGILSLWGKLRGKKKSK